MCIPCWHCMCVTVYVYLCRWTSWKAWWAAVCLPCHQARHSGQCQAPCNRSSPSPTATACGSHSAEGWRPERCQPGGEWKRARTLFSYDDSKSQNFDVRVSVSFQIQCARLQSKKQKCHCQNIVWLNCTSLLNYMQVAVLVVVFLKQPRRPINCVTCYQYVIFE